MDLYAPCLIIYLRINQLYDFGASVWFALFVRPIRHGRQIISFNATSLMLTSIRDSNASLAILGLNEKCVIPFCIMGCELRSVRILLG